MTRRSHWPGILLFGFAAVVFLFVPAVSDPFGLPKESFLKVFLTICAIGVVFSWVRRGEAVLVGNGPIGAAGIVVAALGLSVAFSESPHHSLSWAVTLAGPVCFFVLATQVFTSKSGEWMVRGMAGVGVVVAVIGLLQWAKLEPLVMKPWAVDFKPLAEKMRVYGTLGNPNWVAGFLAALVPSGIAAALVSRRRFVRAGLIVAVAAMLACIAATQSMGGATALAGAGICALVMWVHVEWRRESGASLRSQRNLLRALAAGVLVVAVVGVAARKPVVESVSEHLRGRMYIWRVTGSMLKDSPQTKRLLVGSGYGTFELGYLLSQAKHLAQPENAADMALATNAKHAHNDLLEVLIEQGVVGLGAWLFFVVTYFRYAGRVCRESTGAARMYIIALASGAAAILAQGLVSFPMKVLPTALVLWTLAALTVAAGGERKLHTVEIPSARRWVAATRWVAAWYLGAAAVAGVICVWSVRPVLASHYAWKGMQWEEGGKLQEASMLYERGVGLNARDGELLVARGRLRLVDGDYAGALDDADEAEKYLMDPAVYLLRFEALAALGETDTAAAYRQIAMMMLPDERATSLRLRNEMGNTEEERDEDE